LFECIITYWSSFFLPKVLYTSPVEDPLRGDYGGYRKEEKASGRDTDILPPVGFKLIDAEGDLLVHAISW
jgi:hypothetical protein